MSTPVIWVTQETNLDFAPAERFGEVRFLTREDLNNVKGSLHNEKVTADISQRLRNFDAENDFVVIAGSPYISALVFMLLARKGIRNIKVLRWNNRDFDYIPMHLSVRGSDNG
jgi:hypothetical protein